jgi:glycosyltransferase involved in cell wall biosynthesis
MKALALVDAPGHVCCRYRIGAFEPALRRAGWALTVAGLEHGPVARLRQFAEAAEFDAVILQRKLLPFWQLRALKARSRRLVFDFDDAVLYRDSYDPRGPHDRRRLRRFSATVRAADAVIAGNDFLADCALRAGARPERVRVVPTCIALDRYPNRYDADTRREGGHVLDLTWIGSSSTLRGLEQCRDIWEAIFREVPGVRMRVICDRFPDLGAMPVVAVPWSEASEAAELAVGDVGVGWVPDDLWSRGKCGLKVLQYQAAGLPVIANPVGVHHEMVRPGVNGYLAGTAEEWVAAVRDLAGVPGLRGLMGRASRDAVERWYSTAAWEEAFVAAVADATVSALPRPHVLEAEGRGHVRRDGRSRAGAGR